MPSKALPMFPQAAKAALENTQLRHNLGHATSAIRAKREAVVGELPDDLYGVYLRNTENPLHPAIVRYHPFDGDAMIAAFSDDAVVNDVRREFSGLNAIRAWLDREIIGDKVTMAPTAASQHYGGVIVHDCDKAFSIGNPSISIDHARKAGGFFTVRKSH